MLKVAEKFRSVLRRKGIRDSPGPAGAGSPVGELTYMLNSKKITEYLTPGHHVHLVGIGGVSMRPLGLVLKGMGMEVTGSDMNASVSTDELIGQGIPVAIGHRAENIEGADCIIRTAAAHNDNPEIAAARAAGIPVFERAQAWGEIMKSYHNAICVSGTHGKTTTTSMVTHILMEADMDPTVMIGGYLPLLHAGHRVGHGDTIVLESCEYCDSFLNFFPTLAIVLNVEADHLDYFKDLADIQKSFHKFASLATFGVVANGDDPHTVQAMEGIDPVGACVGPHGGRVGAVVKELGGEKIDIVVWSEDPCQYVRAALSPADVIDVSLIPGQKACRVIVPDDQLSLAIGKEGQNARLAARLTGYKIDIKPASQAEPAGETEEA